MSGYRLNDPNPVYFDLLSLEPLAGGALQFFDIGTTNPRLTYSDQDLTVQNVNPVPLDSAGRASLNIWLDGDYTVRLVNALGATIWTRDVTGGVDAGLAIPTPLVAGQVLSNDGSTLRWVDLLQVPDPTGSDGQVLTTSGGAYVLVTPAPPPTPTPITPVQNGIKIGQVLFQWGTGTLPATGFRQSSVSVNFPTAFSGPPYWVGPVPTNNTHAAEGQIGVPAVTSKSATGFSVVADTDDASRPGASFTGPETFDWLAIGPAAS